MSEVVTNEVTDESQGAPEADAAEAAATPAFDETTWKKRLAGKDQALTAAQKQRDELQRQYDDLQKWKAEKENADLSELERLQRERDELRAAAEAAKSEATRERLGRKFPLAFDLLGDATPLDEVRLAEIETRLKSLATEDDEPEPRIDPNSPRRKPAGSGTRTKEDIRSDLVSALKAQFG